MNTSSIARRSYSLSILITLAGGVLFAAEPAWPPKMKGVSDKAVPPKPGQPAWSKIHAKIDEGADGKIYFSCTLNDGNRAKLPTHGWNENLPGGQIYQYDPATGKTIAWTSLPPKRCTATSIVD